MAGINYEGTNLVGAPFKPYVDQQISRRQELLGALDKTNEQIVWENGNTAWVRLASSINIENSKTPVASFSSETTPEIFKPIGVPTKPLSFAPEQSPTQNVIIGDEGTRRVKLLELGGDPAQYFGNTLAKYLVLFNGTSYQNTSANLDDNGNVLGGPSPLLKEGIGGGANGIYGNNAYGFMGTEFGFTAMPGLLDATITSRNMGSLREATVNIRANSEEQFKLIDNLYCRIGYSMFLEWGNSVYFNNKGEYTRMGADDGVVTLIYEFLEPSLTNVDRCPTEFIKKIEKKREVSNGNYDAIFARVANFSWEFTPEGYYLVTLKLISWGDIIESLGVDATYGDVGFDSNTANQPNNSSALNTFITTAVTPQGTKVQGGAPGLGAGGVPGLGAGIIVTRSSNNFDITKRNLVSEVYRNKNIEEGGKLFGSAFSFSDSSSDLVQESSASDYSEILNYLRPDTSAGKVISARATFNENTYFYVRFGDLLDFIKERLLIYESICGKPIVDIDTNPDKNYCYYTGINMSADPSKVMVGVNLPFDLGTLNGLKNSITGSAWQGEINQETIFSNPGEVAIEPFDTKIPDTEVVVGNIMNIYFEASFLQKTLEERRDKKTKKVSLFSFLNTLIEEANSCLGGVNKLAIRVEDDRVLRIYDQVPIYNTQAPDPTTIINLYGVQLNNGSFVKQFSLKTELTNEFATTVSIGAQSNGNVVGEDATMLSKWNFGLVDRFYPGKVDSQRKPDNNKKEVTPEERINKLVQKLKFMWLGYADGKIANLANLDISFFGGTNVQIDNKTYYFQYFDTKRYSEFVKAQQDWLQELIKLRSEEQQTLSNQIGMLPINISTTMQGISGIRIYDQYPVDVRFIPNYYPQYLKFIIKGVNHSLRDNIWETNIETIAVPKLVKDLKLKEGPITFTQEEALGGEIEQITPEGNTGAGSYTGSPLARRLQALGRTNGNLQFKDVVRVGRAQGRVDSPRSNEILPTVYSVKLASSSNLSLNNWTGGRAVGLNFSQLYWLAKPAQVALQKLAKQATDEGIVFTINSTYRSYAYQQNTKIQYPKNAASPGSSPHGWGGAIDILELNRAVGNSPQPEVNKVQRQTNTLYRWLAANAPKYGWVNPKRLADGKGQEEIWHWEWWGTQGLNELT